MIPEKLKRLWLKYIIGYGKPQNYWDSRWRFKLNAEYRTEQTSWELLGVIKELMEKHCCNSILEIGCGRAILRELPNYLGLDFSFEALKQSKLKTFIYADITNKIPLPANSQDAVLSKFVLLHIPPSKIDTAVAEICRVASKLVILKEPYGTPKHEQPHCWRHNLPELFNKHFNGNVTFLATNK